jgi:hypothetical protein
MKSMLIAATVAVCAAFAASPANAQLGMSSANYRIPTSVINSGGGVATSANYTLTASIGEPVIGPSSSTNYAANAGFLATLIQVTGSPGDLNDDGVVDINDVKLALQVAAGLANGSYPGVDFANGDLTPATPDGKIDIRDADHILRYILGTDHTLP